MEGEIINRVAKSKLKVIDLEEYYPSGNRIQFDIKDWLYEGFVLREKDFRKSVSEHDWSQYANSYVALRCSTEAIVPDWAYMLITSHLEKYSKLTVVGTLEQLESILYSKIINDLDLSAFEGLPVIIKGCAHKPVPTNALVLLTQKLKPIAKSIMFGEACSSVPIYKKKKAV